jgi:tellurite resistance protein
MNQKYRSADSSDRADAIVMPALVSAGAFIALADGGVDPLERATLADFLQKSLLLAVSRDDVVRAFDACVKRLEKRNDMQIILESFQGLAGRSMASVVVRLAEQVAAADRQLHPGELDALGLVRSMLISLPTTPAWRHRHPA